MRGDRLDGGARRSDDRSGDAGTQPRVEVGSPVDLGSFTDAGPLVDLGELTEDPGEVIDLGLDRSEPGGDGDPVTRRQPRWLSALIALITLLVLVASAPLGEPPLTRVGSIPPGDYLAYKIDGGRLYALTLHGTGVWLVSYRLGDGVRTWATPLTILPSDATVEPVGDTVLVSTREAGLSGSRTVAVDASSGRLLWTDPLPRARFRAPGRQVLLAGYLARDGSVQRSVPLHDAGGPGAPAVLVTAVDVRSGARVWTQRIAAGTWTAVPSGSDPTDEAQRLVTVAADGQAQSIDLGTGRVVARGHVPVRGGRDWAPLADVTTVALAGVLLLVGDRQNDRITLTAYRADTLTSVWSVPYPMLDFVAAPCAGVLCLAGADGVSVLDPATGASRWTISILTLPDVVGGWLYALPFSVGSPIEPVLLDPTTGRSALDLANWHLVPGNDGTPYLLERYAYGDTVWIGLLDVRSPRVRPLGTVPDTSGGECRAGQGYLACQSHDGSLTLWRVRS
ncbi:MAG TPA: PQQ-binding-like beta-propeller repeat protein [Micromonosporaceae bacterium]